jgi:hypothetical protein
VNPAWLVAWLVVLSSFVVLATRQLRLTAIGLLGVFVGSNVLTLGLAPRAEVSLSGTASLAAAVILYLAARDGGFGEDPGWRVWPALGISAIATTLAYRLFATAETDAYLQLVAFWLLAIGLAVLLSARGPVRTVLGALLMISGTLDVVRFQPGPHLAASVAFAWLEVLLALVGTYLIEQQHAIEERA